MNKFNYILNALRQYNKLKICPFCKNDSIELIDRKYIVTRLYKCEKCNLQFRYPTDSSSYNYKFYQDNYEQEGGFTTDLPTKEDLTHLLMNNFKNTEKDATIFIEIFESLLGDISKKKIIDYGCSWGYVSHQFISAHMDVQSYEISLPRANFGIQNLNIDIKTSVHDLSESNDLFFSSHVIEHHPDISAMYNLAKKLLSKNGLFIAESPNGSPSFRRVHPKKFSKFWGLVHPNLLSDDFFKSVFSNNPYILASSPYDLAEIKNWDKKSQLNLDTSGDNLLIICLINQEL